MGYPHAVADLDEEAAPWPGVEFRRHEVPPAPGQRLGDRRSAAEVGNGGLQVEDRLGRQPRHGCRPDVLHGCDQPPGERHQFVAQHLTAPLLLRVRRADLHPRRRPRRPVRHTAIMPLRDRQ